MTTDDCTVRGLEAAGPAAGDPDVYIFENFGAPLYRVCVTYIVAYHHILKYCIGEIYTLYVVMFCTTLQVC